MKTNLLLSLALVSVMSISSCKKNVESCKLGKSYVSDGNTTPAPSTFFYYDNGSLQKIHYANNTKDSISYNLDSIRIEAFDSDGNLTSVITGKLDGNGYLTSGTRSTLDFSGNVTSSENYSMLYDSEGHLSQQTVTRQLTTDILQFYYTNGNADSGVLYVAGAWDKKYLFFRGSAINKTAIDDFNGVFTPYFGKPSNNLLDSTHILTAASDTIRIQYAHTLNDDEYVSKTTKTYLSNGVDTKYYTYQYFDCSK